MNNDILFDFIHLAPWPNKSFLFIVGCLQSKARLMHCLVDKCALYVSKHSTDLWAGDSNICYTIDQTSYKLQVANTFAKKKILILVLADPNYKI